MQRRSGIRVNPAILSLFLAVFVASLALIPLVEAQSIRSVTVHPNCWTRLQGDGATYHIIVQSFDRVGLSTKGLPSSISAKFDPSRGQSITGLFYSTLTAKTQTSTPTGVHSFNVIVSAGKTQVQVPIKLKIVPRTAEGASLVLYDFYAKQLSPAFWTNAGVVALASFSSDFGTSYTNLFSLLKRAVIEANEPLSAAESYVKALVTMLNFMQSSGMSGILGLTSPGVAITDNWEIEPLVRISSLIERGDKAAAINEIKNLLPQLRSWLRNIENYKPDGLVVTKTTKEAARNLMLSCINFLEAELIRLQPDTRPPSVKVLSPNGGETLIAGRTFTIRWTATDNVGIARVDIYYSTNGGDTWKTIASGLRNTGSYSFVVPNTPSVNCLIRVDAYDLAGNRGGDTSDRVFTIRR